MTRWMFDRVNVFLFIGVVSFLYDLTAYIGLRDTARFPHPFVYFRSLGDIESLRGFAVMLRQAIFSLVAGGLIGLAVALLILKIDWLTRAASRFLRIAMWFPFLVLFAAPYTFQLGIAATSLASIYHYLTARSFLETSEREAFRYVAGEVTFQAFFFSLLSQIWVQRWNWSISFANNDATLAFVAWGLVLTVLAVINWLFRRTFRAGCGMHAILIDTDAYTSKTNSFVGVLLLAIAWLALWQLTCVSLHYDEFHVIPAMQKVGELLITREVWHDILASLAEIGVGMLFGGLLAFSVAAVMQGRIEIQHVIVKFIPYTYLTPIVLWPLVVHFVLSPSASMNWYRSFFLALGHKMMGVGLLTFFPLLQALWSFRDAPVARLWGDRRWQSSPNGFCRDVFRGALCCKCWHRLPNGHCKCDVQVPRWTRLVPNYGHFVVCTVDDSQAHREILRIPSCTERNR